MDKRITAITIKNCRGYFGDYQSFNSPKGENILIYGENGSGKSSLYKALNSFFLSSRDSSIRFIKNRYQESLTGEIKIQFSDFDNNTKTIITGTEVIHTFADTQSDHHVSFIQNIALIKGFLDYTDLLKVYFHKDAEPNLFELIVLTLLGEHVPISSGGNFKFKQKWSDLQDDLIKNARTRNDRCHINALNFLPVFETHLKSTLDEVFQLLNTYLNKYFNELNIQLDYLLSSIDFNYGRKLKWHTTAELKLIVIKDGSIVNGGYNDFLNEARLSAIAICLYLSSLRINPTNIELKLLYLDDVFIGLDAGNRIPILNILRDEFFDYQKIISTYDRHWFELAKRHSEIYTQDLWLAIEMYVGYDIDPSTGNKINKPLVIVGYSHYEKAIRYLHHISHPDYPAAANYFRKALEELIPLYIPKYELVDEENTQIPRYKLSQLLNKTHRILEKTNNDTTYINAIKVLIHNLLHPLSHHEITSPIYKQELESIEFSFKKLKDQLIQINFQKNYKCAREKKDRLRIKFVIDNSIGHIQYYELILKEMLLFFINNSTGTIDITSAICYAVKCEEIKNESSPEIFFPSKKDARFSYISLKEAVDKIYTYIITVEGKSLSKPINYIDVIEYDDNNNWMPLKEILVR
jgi:energy-coupling factor transporter ATP-binding protein EcfA2